MKKGLAQVLVPRYAEFWNGEAWMEGGSSNLYVSKNRFQILKWRSEVAKYFLLDCLPCYVASVNTGNGREEPKSLDFR